MNTDLKEVIVGSLDVKGVLARRLLPAAVAGAGRSPPAVVVEYRRVAVYLRLLTCKKKKDKNINKIQD